jgi:outer membrane immunogenic protein
MSAALVWGAVPSLEAAAGVNSQHREMNMRKLFLTTAAVVALMADNSFAADMRAPAYKAPTVLPPVSDWSGFYIGVFGGGQASRIGLSNPHFDDSLVFTPNHTSAAVGSFVGVQRQFGQIVLGVEGGYLAAFDRARLTTPSLSIFSQGGIGTAQAKLRDIWSVGGRIGWAAGNWMPYVTGGFANGSFQFDAQDSSRTERARANTGGGYIGAGIDQAITTNWIVGVEYRHYAFSAKTVTGVFSNGDTESVRFAPSTDTIVGRVSYKFDWPVR